MLTGPFGNSGNNWIVAKQKQAKENSRFTQFFSQK